MKRALVIVLFALSAFGAEKWSDTYKRGLAAINAKNYDVAIDAMQHALVTMPNETVAYLPHFWIGVAKFNLGDYDGALRELKTSEEQGAIQNTEHFARLRDFVARANAEKSRAAQSGNADARKAADAAVSHAMTTQMDALAAGADRSDSYRSGQRKLQEAMQQFKSGGYPRASEVANQARELFASAAEDARKAKAARPPAVVQVKPVVQKPVAQAPVAPVDVNEIKIEKKPVLSGAAAPPPPQPVAQAKVAVSGGEGAAAPLSNVPVESEALVSARVALQNFRTAKHPKAIAAQAKKLDDELRAHPNDATIASVNAFLATKSETPKPDLLPAYRAFARGEIDKSVALLTSMISSTPNAEAFLLRGCAKYTAAMLTTKPDLASASNDFKAALRLNRSLRLDRQSFSPKMVAYFEQVKGSAR